MRLTVKELIARAYEVARVLKDADAALLREVATRLDVTYVALSETMERSRELESENANLLSFINTECFVKDGADYDYASTRLPLTPASSRFLAEQQAIGLELGASQMESIDTIASTGVVSYLLRQMAQQLRGKLIL